MNAKAIMTLALRLLGFWVLLPTLYAMTSIVGLLSWLGGTDTLTQAEQPVWNQIITSGFALFFFATFASILLLFAPAIASRSSTESAPAAPECSVRVRDVYIIAPRELGLYSLLSAVPAAQTLTRSMLDHWFDSGSPGWPIGPSLVGVSIYLAGGALLIFGSVGIADVFSRAHGMSDRSRGARPLTTDPESGPFPALERGDGMG